jgi:tetratricopeptide (TPR) repeat protein
MDTISFEQMNSMRVYFFHYDPMIILPDTCYDPNNLSEVDTLINNAIYECSCNNNYKKSIEIFNKLTSLNITSSLINIGDLYFYAYVGDKRDYKKAFEYYKKAESLGNNEVLVAMGFYYLINNVNRDHKIAYEYYKKAESLGVKKSFYELSKCYFHGYYVKKDLKKAFEYLNKTINYYNDMKVNMDMNIAIKELGEYYYYGHYVEKNYYLALDYFTKHGLSIKHTSEKYPNIETYVYNDYRINMQLMQLNKRIDEQQEEIKLLKIDMQYAPNRPYYNEIKYKELFGIEE